MRTLYPTAVASVATTVAFATQGLVPAGVLGCVAASFLGVVGLGAAFPTLGLFGRAIGRVRSTRGLVALTFDDGPHPVHTRTVLDTLEASGMHATFFLVAARVDRHAEVAREIARRGHEVGLHSFGHDDRLALRGRRAVVDDFVRSEEIFARVLGARPSLYRPPVGVASPTIHAVARDRGYRLVGWSVRALDGVSGARPDAVRARIARRAAAGDVVLLHDLLRAREDVAPAGVVALPRVLADLREKGLSATTISELLRASA